MQLDRVELNRPTRRDFLRILAGVTGTVALSCTPKVPEVLTREPVTTPTPQLDSPVSEPTSAVEPTVTPRPVEPTSTPEPTKTPEPTRAPELPRILRETAVYAPYVGDLFKIEGGRRVVYGGVLFSHLPNDSFLVAYTFKDTCPNGFRRSPTFIAPRARIAGAGFLVDNIDTQITPSIMSNEVIGGALSAKEATLQGVVCPAVNGLSISARLVAGTPSKEFLIDTYIALHRTYGANLTREQALRHIEVPYRGPLPEIPAK